MKTIGKAITLLLRVTFFAVGLLAFLGGLYFLATAALVPYNTSPTATSGAQLSQMYAQGIYDGLLACDCLLVALVCGIISYAARE